MTKFVIRSMTTTDYRVATRGYPGQLPTPYHVYLMKPEKRGSAYWTQFGSDIALFNSIADAQAEIDRCLPSRESYAPLLDIVPQDDRDVPTFWDARKREPGARPGKNRVIGDVVVFVEAAVDRNNLSAPQIMVDLFNTSFGRRA